MCNDSAYPKNSRQRVESQKRVKKTKRLFFLASSLGDRNRDGEIASHIPTAPSTHIPAIATGYSSRYVDITLYGSSQLFGSLLTTHCFCLAIVRGIYHCDWLEGEISMLQSYKILRYFSRDKNQTKPIRPTKHKFCKSLYVAHQPATRLFIPRRHAHERLLRTGRSRKDVRSYHIPQAQVKVFWVHREATCTLPAALSSCIFHTHHGVPAAGFERLARWCYASR
jgi:hypothetical protein